MNPGGTDSAQRSRGASRRGLVLGLAIVAGSSLLACSPSTTLNARERFESARAGNPDGRALEIARALPSVLAPDEIVYLETMRWDRLPAGHEEQILRDPVFRRAAALAWDLRPRRAERRAPLSLVGVAYADDSCAGSTGVAARVVRSLLGLARSLVGHCGRGTPGCLGLAISIVVDDGIGQVVSDTLGGAEAVSHCVPDPTPRDDRDDYADEGRFDCAAGGSCEPDDELTPDESSPDEGCGRLTPNQCGETCCWIGYDCCPTGGCTWMGLGCEDPEEDAGPRMDSGVDAGMPDSGRDAGEVDAGMDSGAPDAGDASSEGGAPDADAGGDDGRAIDCTSGPCPAPYICALVGVRTYRCAFVQSSAPSCVVGSRRMLANDQWGSSRNNPICVCVEGPVCGDDSNSGRPLLEDATTTDCASVCGSS